MDDGLSDASTGVAPPTQGTWRSNDYVSAVRLVDDYSSMEWAEDRIYTVHG